MPAGVRAGFSSLDQDKQLWVPVAERDVESSLNHSIVRIPIDGLCSLAVQREKKASRECLDVVGMRFSCCDRIDYRRRRRAAISIPKSNSDNPLGSGTDAVAAAPAFFPNAPERTRKSAKSTVLSQFTSPAVYDWSVLLKLPDSERKSLNRGHPPDPGLTLAK